MKHVKVYALSTCPWCKKVKAFLSDKNISAEITDVDTAPEGERNEALKEVDRLTGSRSFPITVIDQEKVIVGYKPEEMEEALKGEK